jgi:hypothetical protein
VVLRGYLTSWGYAPEFLDELAAQVVSNDANGRFGELGLSDTWTVIRNVFAYGAQSLEEKWKLFEIYAQRDGTDEVQLRRRYLNAFLESDREKLWNYFVNYNKEEST